MLKKLLIFTIIFCHLATVVDAAENSNSEKITVKFSKQKNLIEQYTALSRVAATSPTLQSMIQTFQTNFEDELKANGLNVDEIKEILVAIQETIEVQNIETAFDSKITTLKYFDHWSNFSFLVSSMQEAFDKYNDKKLKAQLFSLSTLLETKSVTLPQGQLILSLILINFWDRNSSKPSSQNKLEEAIHNFNWQLIRYYEEIKKEVGERKFLRKIKEASQDLMSNHFNGDFNSELSSQTTKAMTINWNKQMRARYNITEVEIPFTTVVGSALGATIGVIIDLAFLNLNHTTLSVIDYITPLSLAVLVGSLGFKIPFREARGIQNTGNHVISCLERLKKI